MLSPSMFIHLSKAKMVSPTGQCHAFSVDADGYTRGEGCGVVIIKRLSDAIDSGDHILATIETGTNQDGHSVTPISAPSKEQQIQLLESIYKDYTLDELDAIEYIEAHGTGTVAGDKAEANALGEFFLSKHSSRVRYMGSVKTNIGHLEAAAGVVGLIKVLLMMKHSKIVPSLFAENLNPNIDFNKLHLQVPTKAVEWSTKNKVACINSFGFGGSNSHAVIKSFNNVSTAESQRGEDDHIVCFSGENMESLRGSIQDLIKYPLNIDIRDLSFTSVHLRGHYPYRYATVAQNMEELKQILKNETDREDGPKDALNNPSVVFVFCGMGTSWNGMCQELINKCKPFEEALKEIDDILSRLDDMSVIKSLEQGDISEEFSPIAIFACQVGLFRLWNYFGVTPDFVVGQSVGEIAAAFASGHLTLEDAVKIIYHRTRLLNNVKGGKMVLIMKENISVVDSIIANLKAQANIALKYSPVACAVSGDIKAVDLIKSELTFKNNSTKLIDLDVNVAYHSHHVDACKDGLRLALDDIKPLAGEDIHRSKQMVSTVTGQFVEGPLDSTHWVNNLREPVLFYDAIRQTVQKNKTNIYIEIGPKPVLRAHKDDIFQSENVSIVPSMDTNKEWKQFLSAMSKLYTLGVHIDLRKLQASGKKISVPRYHFTERKCLEISEAAQLDLAGVNPLRRQHPFVNVIQTRDSLHSEGKIILSQTTFPSVFEHKVSGTRIIPGALYAESGFAVINLFGLVKSQIYSVTANFKNPFSLPSTGTVEMELACRSLDDQNDSLKFEVSVTSKNKTYADLVLEPYTGGTQFSNVNIRFIQNQCTEVISGEQLYETLTVLGFDYGPSYMLIKEARKNVSEKYCIAEMLVPASVEDELVGTTIHPSILDNMMQTSVILLDDIANEDKNGILPFMISSLTSFRATQKRMYVISHKKGREGGLSHYQIKLVATSGEIIAVIEDLAVLHLSYQANTLRNAYSIDWSPVHHEKLKAVEQIPSVLYITDFISVNDESLKNILLYDSMNDPWKVASGLEAFENLGTFEFIVISILKDNISYDDDADKVHSMVSGLFKMIQEIFRYTYTNNIHVPVLVFTSHAFPYNNSKTLQPVNPVMSSVWGMIRCVIRESISSGVTLIDVQIPEEKMSLLSLTSVAVAIKHQEEYKHYPEWIFTEQVSCFGQVVPVDGRTPFPSYKTSVVDGSTRTILISKDPNDITETYCIAYQDDERNESCAEIRTYSQFLPNSKLYHVEISGNELVTNAPIGCDGFSLVALESCGTTTGKENKTLNVISCYPASIGTVVRVPEEVVLSRELFPCYVFGNLTQLLVLFSIVDKILAKNITILASNDNIKIAKALEILIRQSNSASSVNISTSDKFKETTSCCEILILLERVDKSIIKAINKKTVHLKIVAISSLVANEDRAYISYKLPRSKLILLCPEEVFSPQEIPRQVLRVRRWLEKRNPEISTVLKQLSATQPARDVFVTQPNSLTELLAGKLVQCHNQSLRVDKEKMFRKDGVYIVVGGLTGLGLLTVKHLAQRGAGVIAILNRRACDEDVGRVLDGYSEEFKCHIKAYRGDVGQINSVQEFFNSIKIDFPKECIKGVFFGAAVLDDKIFLEVTEDSFNYVTVPKIKGAWNLHQMTKRMQLDFFVMYSSIASVVGNIGQSSYALGNAFMDGLVSYRKHFNLAGQTINWGPLDLGLLDEKDHLKNRLAELGFLLMMKNEIELALHQVLHLGLRQVVMVKFNTDTLLEKRKRDTPLPLQYKLQQVFGGKMNNETFEEPQVEEELISKVVNCQQEPQNQRLTWYQKYIIAIATDILGVKKQPLTTSSNLSDHGMDSIVAMTLINLIKKDIKCTLTPMVFLSGNAFIDKIALQIDTLLNNKDQTKF
ncbi:phenolphthiocerol/phthiocerol polyketide synthase subunit C-like [Physella acuta]|uniref:phenolphthiocerol/phthiocerol polyketide synthase subunit C-like n=1 Tax=Physella acuta TaxID=109671 RepID=UPI0027DC8DDB|nr:phenolphthiocerol/phthiocerol polyketide synthase subunit C-like [Physella acuta]